MDRRRFLQLIAAGSTGALVCIVPSVGETKHEPLKDVFFGEGLFGPGDWRDVLGIQAPSFEMQTTIEVAPASGRFYGIGIRTFNEPNEIEFKAIIPGGSGNEFPYPAVDAAFFNVDDTPCCPLDIGILTPSQPAIFTFRAMVKPPVPLNLVLFGRREP